MPPNSTIFRFRRRDLFVIVCYLLTSCCNWCFSQSDISISKPILEYKQDSVIIFYNILNANPDDIFKISLAVTDSSGNNINGTSFQGDIGENIVSGINKKIVWDLEKDNIKLNEGIYIQVLGELVTPPGKNETSIPTQRIKLSKTMFQSVVFPGWSLSKLKDNNLHWLKGVTAYGLLAASIYYNQKAISSYDDYLAASTIENTEKYYNNSETEDQLSEIFAYGAIGIWVIDLIWTAGCSSKKNRMLEKRAKRFSVKPIYDSGLNASLVVITYSF